MAREAMDVCLRVLKESNKSRFDSYSVRNSVLILSHVTFRDCRVHSFSDNFSWKSCIRCDEFSNWSLFTTCIAFNQTFYQNALHLIRVNCATNNSNKNTGKFGGWESKSFAAQTQSFLCGKFSTARLEVLPNFKTRRSLSDEYDG